MEIEKLKQLLAQGAILLDVRTPEEFEDEAVPQSLNIPLDQLMYRAGELPTTTDIVVVCRSGNRSAMAINLLKQMGYNRLHDGVSWSYFM